MMEQFLALLTIPASPHRLLGIILLALPLLGLITEASAASAREPSESMREPVGLDQMMAFARLPFFKPGVTVHYEGSIDKLGGNADWDWWLYEQNGEWVLLDVDGPGCIYNFVQHRYPTSKEAIFRFYFDGESSPRFTIASSEFGKKPPFVAPLADAYIGPEDGGRGPIRVIRSFVPMPFVRSCRVTSSVKLTGFDKAKGEGGWGHIMYHTYPTAEGVKTFTGHEDFAPLLALWKRVGEDPKDATGNETTSGTMRLAPGASATIFERSGEGSVAKLRLNVRPMSRDLLANIRLRLTWDGHARPDVECPLGAFFGNELGRHATRYLAMGMTPDGAFHCYFPMPYWQSAKIEILRATGGADPMTIEWEVQNRPTRLMAYPRGRCGYFRTLYLPPTPSVEGRDTVLGRLTGRGHFVGGLVTARHEQPGAVTCEGDVRVYLDGNATPQVESDGSESWSCYGWGFPTPPQNNPTSGYDGEPNSPWSMLRLCTGDWYPFGRELVFGIEHGGHNDQPLVTSGAISYYGDDTPMLELTDELDVGNEAAEQAHRYQVKGATWHGELESAYEGNFEDVKIRDSGRAFTGSSEFTVAIRPDNAGVMLRRRCDQAAGRRRARVYVDGTRVTERDWYDADRNPHRRWLDSEFAIPAAYTAGKSRLQLRIEYVPAGDAPDWNEFRYWVYSLRP